MWCKLYRVKTTASVMTRKKSRLSRGLLVRTFIEFIRLTSNNSSIKTILFAGILLFSPGAFAAAGVASAHPLATAAGIKMLKMGGNAFDAAIAVTSTLAVVEPASSGMGGGGFWLLHDAANDKSIMVDGREKAPLAATRDMYLDENGNVIPDISINGPLSVGIPGEPAALVWLAQNYGALPLTTSLQPAIDAARNGFAVTERYHSLADWRKDLLNQYPAAAVIFLDNGETPEIGHLIIQEDLANTLESIANNGHAGFYQGDVATALVDGFRDVGGIWTMQDLAEYQVVIREPVSIDYRGMKVTSTALPSSGGLVLAEMLNILENHDVANMDEADFIHVNVEAMRRAYRDRAQYMGDSDFVDLPMEMLQGKDYADGLNQSIRMDAASTSASLAATESDDNKGEDTTHFSVIDKDGNRVSATLSINYPFGSGVVPPGTGVLLNDEMDDFSSKPGTPNAFGLVGAEANAIEPGKRMLSSMSPTFVEDDQRIAVLGSPGGSRIITMVLLGILEFEKGGNADAIVNRPRFHHQYLPDSIQYEKDTLNTAIISDLANRGHKFKPLNRTWGNMHVVILDKAAGTVEAASDGRGEGEAQVIE
jgi:gamma-glutamyltranspeptidase/glutathione hydrolase